MEPDQEYINRMWREWFMNDALGVERSFQHFFHWLPHDPRCKLCNAPFQGFGGIVVSSLYGRRQSNLNPQFCNMCEEFARQHPGGAEVEMAMLFADVRGSAALSEQLTPGVPASHQPLLRRRGKGHWH